MGWKNVKEALGMDEIRLFYGEHKTLMVYSIPCKSTIGQYGGDGIFRLFDREDDPDGAFANEMNKLGPARILALLERPDKFEISESVFAIQDGKVIEYSCERRVLGRVTHCGVLMVSYPNISWYTSAGAAFAELESSLKKELYHLEEQIEKNNYTKAELKSKLEDCAHGKILDKRWKALHITPAKSLRHHIEALENRLGGEITQIVSNNKSYVKSQNGERFEVADALLKQNETLNALIPTEQEQRGSLDKIKNLVSTTPTGQALKEGKDITELLPSAQLHCVHALTGTIDLILCKDGKLWEREADGRLFYEKRNSKHIIEEITKDSTSTVGNVDNTKDKNVDKLKAICVNRSYLHNLVDGIQADVSQLGEEGEQPSTSPNDIYTLRGIIAELTQLLYGTKEVVKIFEIDTGSEFLFACAKREEDLVLLGDWEIKEIPEDWWTNHEMLVETEDGSEMVNFKQYMDKYRPAGKYGVFSRAKE